MSSQETCDDKYEDTNRFAIIPSYQSKLLELFTLTNGPTEAIMKKYQECNSSSDTNDDELDFPADAVDNW